MADHQPNLPPAPLRATTAPIAAIPPARLAVLFMVMLVAAAGNTAMQSILPAIGTKLGIGDVWVSLAFSWSALLWVLTAPRWARQSDQRGRRVLMTIGIIGFMSSMLLCGFVLWAGLSGLTGVGVTFALFALFRSLYGGFGSAAPPAVQAYVASRTEAAERTKALSLVASSFGLGTVIGPTIAPWLILPVVGLAGPLFVFAAIGGAVLIAIKLALPDDTPRFAVRGRIATYPAAGGSASSTDDEDESDPELADGHRPDEPAERIGWTYAPIRPWNMAGLLGGHAQAMVMGVIGFLILDRLHLRLTPDLAAQPTGHVLWVGALATLLAQWGLIPLLSPSPRTAVLAGATLGGIGAMVVGIGQSLDAISIGFAITMLGFGLFRPGFTAGASLAVPRHLQGQVAGQTASINGAAYIFAPAVGVALYNWHAELTFALIALICAWLVGWGWHALRLPPAD
jgi:hypothetical protein